MFKSKFTSLDHLSPLGHGRSGFLNGYHKLCILRFAVSVASRQ
jgi:hypothetical protein